MFETWTANLLSAPDGVCPFRLNCHLAYLLVNVVHYPIVERDRGGREGKHTCNLPGSEGITRGGRFKSSGRRDWGKEANCWACIYYFSSVVCTGMVTTRRLSINPRSCWDQINGIQGSNSVTPHNSPPRQNNIDRDINSRFGRLSSQN